MNGPEILRIRYAIAKDHQPPGAQFPTTDTVPVIPKERVLPVCFSCPRDFPFPLDPRIIGNILNRSYIDWETAISQLLNHQDRHTENGHGRIIERVDHSVILYNAAIIFQNGHEGRP